MKRALCAAIAALAMSAFAADWVKIGEVRIAEPASMAASISKICEMSGNQMVGAIAAAKVSEMPGVAFFGPAREGQAIEFPVFAKGRKDVEGDDLEYAVLYPVSTSKEAFMKRHKGCVETNGLVKARGGVLEWDEEDGDDEEDDDEDAEFSYVGFSKDGKWAAASDKPEQVRMALAGAKDRPFRKGTVASVLFGKKAIRQLSKALCECACDGDEKAAMAKAREILDGIEGLSASAGVYDSGLRFNASIKPVKGTKFDTLSSMPIEGRPLDFAATNSIGATVLSGVEPGASEAYRLRAVQEVLKAFAKNGLDLSPWLVAKSESGVVVFSIDLRGMIAFFASDKGKMAAEKMGKSKSLQKDIQALQKDLQFQEIESLAPGKGAARSRIDMVGYSPPTTLADRFVVIFPDAASKKPFYASAAVLSGTMREIIRALMSVMPEEKKQGMIPMVAMIPGEGPGGMAAMSWRNGARIEYEMRVSADEVKSVCAVASAAFAAAAMNGLGGGDDGDDDDDEDDDD